LLLHVQPGARRTAVAGVFGDRLKVAVHAPPTAGRANAELTRFLARELGVPKTDVVLKAGASGRRKSVLLCNVSPQQVAVRLKP